MPIPRQAYSFALTSLLALGLSAGPAAAGTFVNGSSYSPDHDNVWFLGNEIVEYCIVQDSKYPVPGLITKKVVEDSLAEWRDFFKKYGMDRMSFERLQDGRKLKMSLKFKQVETCTNPQKQLKFMFGSKDQNIHNILEVRPEVIGFAARDAYDHKTYRNGGVVYVEAHKMNMRQFKHVVLHELGHVFGMEHNSLPVMVELTPEFFYGNLGQHWVAKIETSVWPFKITTGTQIDYATRTLPSHNIQLGDVGNLFGFTLDGRHAAALVIGPHSQADGMYDIALRLTDLGGSKKTITFDGKFRANYDSFSVGEGPVLNTSYWCDICSSKESVGRAQLDTKQFLKGFEGTFEWNGRKYPALIDSSRGVRLRVYIAETNSWWSTERYPALLPWAR